MQNDDGLLNNLAKAGQWLDFADPPPAAV